MHVVTGDKYGLWVTSLSGRWWVEGLSCTRDGWCITFNFLGDKVGYVAYETESASRYFVTKKQVEISLCKYGWMLDSPLSQETNGHWGRHVHIPVVPGPYD